ncbi:MAG: MBL fold metallo-hydrolase [Oscillospiraceae bacterium]
MKVHSFPLGDIGTNCYLVSDDKGLAAIVDPGDWAEVIIEQISGLGLTPKAILLTHGHYDHTTAVAGLLKEYPGLLVYVHKLDTLEGPMTDPLLYTPNPGCKYYDEGDDVSVGDLQFHVLHTPGHSMGSVTLQCGNILFTGDTLFEGSMGRTDLTGGNEKDIYSSLKRLGSLVGNYTVCPGHEGTSTLDIERESNPYLIRAMRQLS